MANIFHEILPYANTLNGREFFFAKTRKSTFFFSIRHQVRENSTGQHYFSKQVFRKSLLTRFYDV